MCLCAATPGFPESIKMKQKVVANNITITSSHINFRLWFWVLITTRAHLHLQGAAVVLLCRQHGSLFPVYGAHMLNLCLH